MKDTIQLEEFVQWDVRTWSKALCYWDKTVEWDKIDNALELGARQGGLSLWLALKGTHVLCSDYEKAEETARPLHDKHGVGDLIHYEDIDATNIPYENHFDLILFKSVVGGIGKLGGKAAQEKVFEQIYKALKPGGVLLFAENLESSALHQYLRKKYNAWGDYWRYLSKAELGEFLAPFSSYTLHTTGFFGTFGRSEAQKRFFTRVDEIGPNWMFPAKWKYVAYGIAIK